MGRLLPKIFFATLPSEAIPQISRVLVTGLREMGSVVCVTERCEFVVERVSLYVASAEFACPSMKTDVRHGTKQRPSYRLAKPENPLSEEAG